jgi:hypothetical protein
MIKSDRGIKTITISVINFNLTPRGADRFFLIQFLGTSGVIFYARCSRWVEFFMLKLLLQVAPFRQITKNTRRDFWNCVIIQVGLKHDREKEGARVSD